MTKPILFPYVILMTKIENNDIGKTNGKNFEFIRNVIVQKNDLRI